MGHLANRTGLVARRRGKVPSLRQRRQRDWMIWMIQRSKQPTTNVQFQDINRWFQRYATTVYPAIIGMINDGWLMIMSKTGLNCQESDINRKRPFPLGLNPTYLLGHLMSPVSPMCLTRMRETRCSMGMNHRLLRFCVPCWRIYHMQTSDCSNDSTIASYWQFVLIDPPCVHILLYCVPYAHQIQDMLNNEY